VLTLPKIGRSLHFAEAERRIVPPLGRSRQVREAIAPRLGAANGLHQQNRELLAG
jgi:hypothetical protein